MTGQVLLLCVIGIPIGLLLGILSAKGILTAATSLVSPEIFLVQNRDELNLLIAESNSGKVPLRRINKMSIVNSIEAVE